MRIFPHLFRQLWRSSLLTFPFLFFLVCCPIAQAVLYADVSPDSWYYQDVYESSDCGFFQGYADGLFRPANPVSLAEVTTIAVRLYEAYTLPESQTVETESAADNMAVEPAPNDSSEQIESSNDISLEGTEQVMPTSPWYAPYVAKARAYQLLPADWQPDDTPATRQQSVYLLARALPKAALPTLNQITTLPDLSPEAFGYTEILRCYQAGVVTGSDNYGTFRPSEAVSRAEISALTNRLFQPEQRIIFTLAAKPQKEVIIYGKSGAGRDLKVYQIGNGPNVLIAVFALHGFEDGWPQDGAELTFTAESLANALIEKNTPALSDWTVYLFPCANPDGLNDGWSANGPGRCTTHILTEAGEVVYGNGKGIDLNRSFPRGFSVNNSNRNYTGSAPLSATEAVALAHFVQEAISPEGKNILLDVHGWTQQLVAKDPRGRLVQHFQTYFPQNRPTPSGSHGYLVEWAQTIGYDALLFEFPYDVSSHSSFVTKGYDASFIQAVLDLLATY